MSECTEIYSTASKVLCVSGKALHVLSVRTGLQTFYIKVKRSTAHKEGDVLGIFMALFREKKVRQRKRCIKGPKPDSQTTRAFKDGKT